MTSPARDLRRYLAQVPDPRGRKGTRHPLSAILTAVICAVLSGANGYKPIAQWLHTQTVDFCGTDRENGAKFDRLTGTILCA